MDWQIRPGEIGDAHLVFSSWCLTTRAEQPYRWMSTEAFAFYRTRIELLVHHVGFSVVYDRVDPTLIYGWACGQPGKLYMVWVRKKFRKMGMGSTLVQHVSGDSAKQYTFSVRELHTFGLVSKWQLTEYNPFIIDETIFPEVLVVQNGVREYEKRVREAKEHSKQPVPHEGDR